MHWYLPHHGNSTGAVSGRNHPARGPKLGPMESADVGAKRKRSGDGTGGVEKNDWEVSAALSLSHHTPGPVARVPGAAQPPHPQHPTPLNPPSPHNPPPPKNGMAVRQMPDEQLRQAEQMLRMPGKEAKGYSPSTPLGGLACLGTTPTRPPTSPVPTRRSRGGTQDPTFPSQGWYAPPAFPEVSS